MSEYLVHYGVKGMKWGFKKQVTAAQAAQLAAKKRMKTTASNAKTIKSSSTLKNLKAKVAGNARISALSKSKKFQTKVKSKKAEEYQSVGYKKLLSLFK